MKDAVAMTLFLADQPQAGGLFNLGSGVANSWIDLAEAIFAALDLEPRIDFVEMPESLREKYQYYTCANIAKLREAGYDHPIASLREAVADYVRNYLAKGLGLGE